MAKSLISVIVPIYNVHDYLGPCVKSVLNQTYKDFELILVDDGSTDGSSEMCDQFSREDGRIRVIHQPNGGLSCARNSGMDVAQGEFIYFIDGDDVIHPQSLELHIQAIEGGDYDFSVSYAIPVMEDDRDELASQPVDIPFRSRVVNQIEFVNGLYNYYDGFGISFYVNVWNKLYRKSFVDDMRFKKLKIEDLEWNNRIGMRMRNAILIETTLYYWIIRSSSASHADESSFQIDHFDCFEACLAEIPEGKSMQEVLCLDALFRRIMSSRHNLKGTSLQAEAIKRGCEVYKKYIPRLRNCDMRLGRKITLMAFCRLPFLYKCYRYVVGVPYHGKR